MLAFRIVDGLRTNAITSRACTVGEAQVPLRRPPLIDGINLTGKQFIEDYEVHPPTVRAIVSLTWTRPVIEYGRLREYGIYLTDGRVLSPDEKDVPNKYLNTVCGTCRICGNFCGGLIFAYFVSWSAFVEIKTVKNYW